jgi:uncharacterized protein
VSATAAAGTVLGSVGALWRYPVKSMMGEELNAVGVTERGVLGDRAYALIDRETGKVASAKQPRKWAKLFDCRAAFIDEPSDGHIPPVRITLPDGSITGTDDEGINDVLSKLFDREVSIETSAPEAARLEEYWPDIEGLAYREAITDEAMPPGTFFDLGVVHVLTTGTIDKLRELYPDGRFEVRRFRPNIVVGAVDDAKDFVENAWIGGTISIGDSVRLKVTGPCPRCVMTTLPQGDLPKDPGILRAAAKHNEANVGVYAAVAKGGTIRRGDAVTLG